MLECFGLVLQYCTSIDGIDAGFKGLCVFAVLGGIGLIPGAFAGGFLLGITEAMVSGYWSTELRDPFVFLILILILIIKPTGLLGKDEKERCNNMDMLRRRLALNVVIAIILAAVYFGVSLKYPVRSYQSFNS